MCTLPERTVTPGNLFRLTHQAFRYFYKIKRSHLDACSAMGSIWDLCTDMYTCVPLPVQVFPAHGAGSPCGKNLSTALYSTIGKELATNPALQFSQEQVGQ